MEKILCQVEKQSQEVQFPVALLFTSSSVFHLCHTEMQSQHF